ncbi:MAG: rhodanese-related sulfurtransferase [Gammaproteobacteria bacterium]|jgi:rhodanese-related sulfurtransferase
MEKLPEFIANHLFLVSLLVAITSLLLWNILAGSIGASQIVPAEATRLINHENAEILDLRSTEDFAKGHILNSVNLVAATLDEKQKELEKYKDKTVILCCNQGQESVRVARTLKMKGIEKIYCLKGGIIAWQNANLPLTKNT